MISVMVIQKITIPDVKIYKAAGLSLIIRLTETPMMHNITTL